MIRLLIADDQALIRQGLRALLSLEDGIEVVALASDGDEALDAIAEHRPDVVLMDIRMPRLDGVSATQLIHERHPDVAVLILTTFDERQYVVGALRAGARGYLLKDSESEDVAAAVRVVAAGGALIQPSLMRTVVDEVARLSNNSPSESLETQPNPLTAREIEVLRLAAGGHSDAQIAAHLFLSVRTVGQHLRSVYSKLGVSSRTAAFHRATERHLL